MAPIPQKMAKCAQKVSKPEGRSPAHKMEFDHAELKEIIQPTAEEMMEAMGIWKNGYLNAGHKQVMLKVLKEKGRIFHLPDPTPLPILGEDKKPRTFRLNMKHDQAIRTRPYRTSPALQGELHKKIDELLKWGVLVEGPKGGSFLSKYSSAVILVKKPNGKYRYVVGFLRNSTNTSVH